jgi:hypothetical protein
MRIMSLMDQGLGRRTVRLRRVFVLGLLGATAILLAACQYEIAGADCVNGKSNGAYAGAGGTCELRYDRG